MLSVVASTYLLVMLRFNARIFLGHYPEEIRQVVPPRSEKERRVSILLGMLAGVPFAGALLWRTATLGDPPRHEHIAIPNPYVHHFKEFLMGTAGLIVVGLAIAAVVSIQF